MRTVFISHSQRDKPFVRKLASVLAANGVRAWVDETEIMVGESLLEKISSQFLMQTMSLLFYQKVVFNPHECRKKSRWLCPMKSREKQKSYYQL